MRHFIRDPLRGLYKVVSRTPKFQAEVPKLHEYIGRYVTVKGVGKVMIGSIVGNVGLSLRDDRPRPMFYEINGRYLVSMLRFHAEMEGASDITEEQFRDFENMGVAIERTQEKDLADKA